MKSSRAVNGREERDHLKSLTVRGPCLKTGLKRIVKISNAAPKGDSENSSSYWFSTHTRVSCQRIGNVVAERFNLHVHGETISKKQQALGSNTDSSEVGQADDSLDKTRKLLRTSPSHSVVSPLNHKEMIRLQSGHRDSDRVGLEK
jgi:hypothetical protein